MRRVLLSAAAILIVAGCGYPDPYSNSANSSVESASPSPSPGQDSFSTGANLPTRTYPDGLQFADVKAGTGPQARVGDTLQMQYTGWLTDGTEFDSNRGAGGSPFTVTIGTTQVIDGWTEGLQGMRQGGIRRLVIPPTLGYGPAGSPPKIPANATLVFLVEAVSLTQATPSPTPTSSPSASPST